MFIVVVKSFNLALINLLICLVKTFEKNTKELKRTSFMERLRINDVNDNLFLSFFSTSKT
jgi:hypothetical protein